MYGKTPPQETSLMIRISLADLVKFGPAKYSYYYGPPGTFTFTPVQGAKSDKIYWATHNNNAEILIFEWDESLPWKGIKVYNRTIPPWAQIYMGTAKCGIQTSIPSSSLPLESEWCSRSDSRIQTGWISQNYVGFLWDADALTRTERNAVFPWPYINTANFDLENNMSYMGRPYIWSPNNAWLFASSAVNENGDVGVIAYYGGLDNPPSLAFGVVDDPTKSTSLGSFLLLIVLIFLLP